MQKIKQKTRLLGKNILTLFFIKLLVYCHHLHFFFLFLNFASDAADETRAESQSQTHLISVKIIYRLIE